MKIKEETIKLAKDNGFELQSLNMGIVTIAKVIADDNNYVVGSKFHRIIVVNRLYLEEEYISDDEFNNIIINAIKKFLEFNLNNEKPKPYLSTIENEKLANLPYVNEMVENYTDSVSEQVKNDISYIMGPKKED